MVVVAANHSAWSTISDNDSVLAQAPWIMRETGSGSRSIVEQQLLGDLEAVNIKLELGSSEATHNAVLAGLGISCLSRHIVHRSLVSGALQHIAPQRTLLSHFYIVQHRQRKATPAIKEFLSLCSYQN